MKKITETGKVVSISRGAGSSSGGGSLIGYAQPTTGAGIPARVGITPGSATCNELAVVGGDFVKTGSTITVYNWSFDIAGATGDRVVQIAQYGEFWHVVGWSCLNVADPADIVEEGAPPA